MGNRGEADGFSLQGQASYRCEVHCCPLLRDLYLSRGFLPYMVSIELGEE